MQLADAAMVEDLPRLLESLLDAPDPELRASAAFALGALLPAETSAAAATQQQQQQPDAGGHPPELSPQQHEVGEVTTSTLISSITSSFSSHTDHLMLESLPEPTDLCQSKFVQFEVVCVVMRRWWRRWCGRPATAAPSCAARPRLRWRASPAPTALRSRCIVACSIGLHMPP